MITRHCNLPNKHSCLLSMCKVLGTWCHMFKLDIISSPYNNPSRRVVSTLLFRWANALRGDEYLPQLSTGHGRGGIGALLVIPWETEEWTPSYEAIAAWVQGNIFFPSGPRAPPKSR